MNKTFLIQNRILIRIIFCAQFSQFFYESCFSLKTSRRDDNRFSLPADNPGMHKNALRRKLRNRQTNLPIEIFQNDFPFVPELDFFSSPKENIFERFVSPDRKRMNGATRRDSFIK